MHGLSEAVTHSADVLLVVEQQEFPAQQFLLAANCEVFASMLLEAADKGSRSPGTGRRLRIPLTGDSANDVTAALRFLYRSIVCNGALPTLSSVEDAIGLAKFGHKYQSTGFSAISENYLVEQAQSDPSLLTDPKSLAVCISLAESCKMHNLLAHCELHMINSSSEEFWQQTAVHCEHISKQSLLRVLRGLGAKATAFRA